MNRKRSKICPSSIETFEPMVLMSASVADDGAETLELLADDASPNQAPSFFRLLQHPVVLENTTFIQDIDAEDLDGDELRFFLGDTPDETEVPGGNINIFGSLVLAARPGPAIKIDPITGVLEFVSGPDFETSLLRFVNVKVTDGIDVVEKPVWITIADAESASFAQSPPRFLDNTPGQVIEHPRSESVIDLPGAVDPDGRSLTFSIVDEEHPGFFAIGNTGDLTYIATPRITDPDTGFRTILEPPEDGRFDLTLRVSDGELSEDMSLTIQLTDSIVDNSPPTVLGLSAGDIIDVPEGQTYITQFQATDPDGDFLRSFLSFFGSADNANDFRTDRDGTFRFAVAPDFEQPTDIGGDNIYSLAVQFTESGSSDRITVPFFVRVVDVEETGPNNAPEFTNAVTGQLIVQQERIRDIIDLDATDADGEILRYSILEDPLEKFFIHPATGELRFVRNEEFEFNQDNTYTVTVGVTDQRETTELELTVRVEDFNELANQTPFFVNVSQGQVIQTPQGQRLAVDLNASDADGQTLRYELTGTDAQDFRVDSSTGEVYFRQFPTLSAPADANGDNRYELTVIASDGLDAVSRDIIVAVENAPLPNQAPTFGNLQDGQNLDVVQGTTEVIDAEAGDPDGDTLTYSISGGADAGQFDIDPVSGVLFFNDAPNFDAPADENGDGRYDLQVSVSDGELADTADVVVTVTEEPEPDPVEPPAPEPDQFPDDRPTIRNVVMDGVLSVEERSKFVVFLNGDSPSGNPVTYSIDGGPDSWAFFIDPVRGELAFFDEPDFESPVDANGDNDYEITLRVSDGDLFQNFDVKVRVRDGGRTDQSGPENEAPFLTNLEDGQTILVPENTDFVHNVMAIDPDGMPISIRVGQGPDHAFLRTRSAENGATELFFSETPDFENPRDSDADNIYAVDLFLGDGFILEVIRVNIQVTDVDEGENGDGNASPVFDNVGQNQVIDVAEGSRLAFDVDASDEDDDDLRYEILGGEDNWLFSMDENTGEISFVDLPDFDLPTDTDGDNDFELLLRVFDGSAFTDRAVTIRVFDADGAELPAEV